MSKLKTIANWDLPGLDKFSEEDRRFIELCITQEDIVFSIHSMGWAYWPVKNRGFLNERMLRLIADFIEAQNKPFWDECEKHLATSDTEYTDDGLC